MIFSPFHRFALLATVFASLHSIGFAASYIRPNDSKELFQLEKIPLRVHSMKEISSQLIILAQRPQDKSPAQMRASAQLLALAMRLNPTGQEARKIDKAFSKGQEQPPSEKQQIIKAQSKLRFYSRWLSSPDAGTNANLLASYLTDATKTLSPDTLNNADTANWTEVVPDIERFAPPKPDTKPTADETNPPDNRDEKTPIHPSPQLAQFHLAEVKLRAPLITQTTQKYRDPKSNYKTRYRTLTNRFITSISIQITPQKKQSGTLKISYSPRWPNETEKHNKPTIAEKSSATLMAFMKSRHSKLSSSKATVKTEHGSYALSNNLAITAPVAMMLEASLTNQPLRDDVHVCAAITPKGKLIQPTNFWKLIEILRKTETGGRLIVSSQSAKLLSQLLVYGEVNFFSRWEIFTAETLDQAMEVAIQASPKGIAEAHTYFKSVQQLATKSDVTKLAVNRAVRKRLTDILQLAPNHLSSRVLLIQGGGKRPMRISQNTLAHELLPIIQSIDKTLSASDMQNRLPSSVKLKNIHSNLRESLDPLEKIIDRSNDDLYEETIKLTNEFRRLITIARRISGDSNERSSLTKSSDAIIFTMQGECAALKEKVEKIIAESK